jgi:hypothetical protein
VNCDDLDRALSVWPRLPQFSREAQDHLRSCDRCRGLVSAFSMPGPVDSSSPETLRQITESIATGLRPVRPLAAARYLFAILLGVFVLIVALGVYRLGPLAIAVMTPLQTVTILGALAIVTGLLADSLVRQMAPGSRHTVSPGLLPVGITIALTIAIVVLFQFQHEGNFWGNAWRCIRAGVPIGVLAAVPCWLVLRRGAILSARMTGAATGLFAGLAGTSVLEIHCPNLDAWHILVSHLGVAILCAAAGLAIGRTAEIIGRPPSRQEYRAGA